ncbi:hypothetical protein J4216_02315 [Candidatus Woesearchaeota archaeon]|nr:hypothetical protein [Candidatus Woesearchaeota archaeon]
MSKWNFINGLNKDKMDIDPKWLLALEAALTSKATPIQSGYHVNTGAVTKNGNIVAGSNHEIGISSGMTHGEEAVIAAALENFGSEDSIQIIAFVGLGGNEIPNPCGNCRDAIKQYTDLANLVIINAPREGGTAVLVPGNAYFKSNFTEVIGEESRLDAIKQAIFAEQSAYDIYLTESSPKIYGAVIVCENGNLFRGSFRGDVAYHPELPISAAICNFRDGSNDSSRRYVKEIVVVSSGSIPNVMYKDRQHALEFAEAIQSLNEKSGEPLPVYIINVGNDGSIQTFKTDTNEWLPHSFSPKNLGLENRIAAGYAKLFR